MIKGYGYRSTELGEFVSEKHNHKFLFCRHSLSVLSASETAMHAGEPQWISNGSGNYMCTTLRKKFLQCNVLQFVRRKTRITSVCQIDKLMVVLFRNELPQLRTSVTVTLNHLINARSSKQGRLPARPERVGFARGVRPKAFA